MDEKGNEKLELLEEEGEVAADYLEELLDILDYDGDIVIDVENDRASVAIVTEEENGRLERLVGKDGEVLEALQELTRLAVQSETDGRSRLMLDIDNFRADRKAELQEIAADAVEEIRGTGDSIALEPMNPFERKVCHDVAADEGMFSKSEGGEPNRYVVIYDIVGDGEDEDSHEDAVESDGSDEREEAEIAADSTNNNTADSDAADDGPTDDADGPRLIEDEDTGEVE